MFHAFRETFGLELETRSLARATEFAQPAVPLTTFPTVPAPADRRRPWFVCFALAALLLAHAWLALSATANKTTAVDEMAHVTAGHAMWARGDYRLQPENGNLPQRWEGLAAWLRQDTLPPAGHRGWTQPNVWALGHDYFHRIGNPLPDMLRAARAMNLAWSVATGVLVFCWSRRLFGDAGAWVSAMFWAFCPTFLAHGALATSDMCMTFLMLASVGAYWRHLYDGCWRTGLLSALVFGLAFVAKYSAVLLAPMLGLLALARLFDHRPFVFGARTLGGWRRALALFASAGVHLLAAWAIIWLFHGFRFAPSADPNLVADYTRPWATVLSSLGGAWAGVLGWARGAQVLPDAYLYGFGFVLDLARERGAFLSGETRLTGWWYFFPYAFLVKTPLALLAALAAATWIGLRRWMRTHTLATDARRIAPLLALSFVYWGFSLTSTLNIGHRHLLPIYPVLFIAVGALGWAARHRSRAWMGMAAVVLAGQIVASAAIRPHYLAFFNTLVGGPAQGYRHLVDSSLDWGQDLPELAEWLQRHELPSETTPVYYAYFGTGDPEYHGIRGTAMVPLLRAPAADMWYRLTPGVYCISATMLSQAYSPIRGRWSMDLEKEYQDLRALSPALLDYAAHPDRRAAWEAGATASQWRSVWQRFEQLQFARLCTYLRFREPDTQIGYAINVYVLTRDEIEAVTSDIAALHAAASGKRK